MYNLCVEWGKRVKWCCFDGVCLAKHWPGDLEQICGPFSFSNKRSGSERINQRVGRELS